MKPETRLTAKILDYLRAIPESWWCKFPGGPFKRGIPDILGLMAGRFYAFEVKSPDTGYQPTKLQLLCIAAIRRAGGTADIVYSLEDVKAIVG